MRTPGAVLAACVLLAVSACGTSSADAGASGNAGTTASRDGGDGDSVARFGNRYRFDSGISVTVSEPVAFQPSEAAYPQAANAVSFEIAVRNETDHAYRLSSMAVKVTAEEAEVKQIVDPTQGYTGVTGSVEGLPVGRKTQLSLAFAVPQPPAPLKLTLRPDKARPARVTYIAEPRPASSQ